MFTQQAPSLVRALREVLQPEQLEQLTRSLGNCQQPIAHRGPVHISPPPNLGRNERGVYGPGAWDPAQYPGLVPSAGNQALYDIGGMDAPVWNTGNKYASAFNFPTDQYFTQNQFFGGPQVYISQNANIENITNQNFEGDTLTANNITVKQFNDQDIPGPAGPAGSPGEQGQPGAPGEAGIDAVIPVGNFRPLQYLKGRRPKVQVLPREVPPRVGDIWVRHAVEVVVPTAVSFNTESCEVTFSATTTVYAVAASTAATTLLSKLAFDALNAGTPIPPVTIAGAAFQTQLILEAEIKGIDGDEKRVFMQPGQ